MPSRDPRPLLFEDPRLPRPGGSPYERLDARLRAVGHPGVGPASLVGTRQPGRYWRTGPSL